MHYGYRIVEDMIDGLLATGWMKKDSRLIDDFRGPEPAQGLASGST